AQNGSRFSGGGGIALYGGADKYRITNNMICGNMSQQYGGGIGHFGLSDGGLIEHNSIISNESFDEGGGIHVGGENAPANGLSPGSGSVVINQNLIQGNKAGDDGGGIRTRKINGQDVAANPGDPTRWFRIDIFNNIIVNNSSADHGGGLSFDDTVQLDVVGNTIARNDSTSTGSGAFGGPCLENSPIGQRCPSHEAIGGLVSSVPQVAGIASFAQSTLLYAALTAPGSFCAGHSGDPRCATFANPLLVDDIVWQNRSFYWDSSANNNLGALLLASATPTGPSLPGGYWDFAVYGVTATMSPTYSLLTNGIGATPSGTNVVGVDPRFVGSCGPPYAPPQVGPFVGSCFNVYQASSKGSALGNFVTATFTPNGVQGDYHLGTLPFASPAIGRGGAILYELQNADFDGDPRKQPVDVGADQTKKGPGRPPGGCDARF
ncbi:MAG: signal peptide protein, partial [bacterium]|nr:signal peptide protein [bacterium]